ncbi:hypothetical protein [Chromobacterium sinusclupearum]|uniref:hypothetical protein n=1 Tax=Chromobacterium sinusclupearum TaxID=2077146 RepID=UPI0018EB0B34|nr:hypothetical protein [Chromobacterium sinusclupearum]
MPKSQDLKPEDTKLFPLYVHELWWLANAICQKTERLFNEVTVPENGSVLEVNPELHSLIASVLSDAANLKKFLNTPSAKLNGESGRQYRLRRARVAALKSILDGVHLTELLNVKVRNTLEHFDEYLDEANLTISEAKNPPSPIAAYNMILSHWEAVEPRVYPIRLYISKERKFYNMKWSVDLDAMNKEAAAVAERLMAYMGGAQGGGRRHHVASQLTRRLTFLSTAYPGSAADRAVVPLLATTAAQKISASSERRFVIALAEVAHRSIHRRQWISR